MSGTLLIIKDLRIFFGINLYANNGFASAKLRTKLK